MRERGSRRVGRGRCIVRGPCWFADWGRDVEWSSGMESSYWWVVELIVFICGRV